MADVSPRQPGSVALAWLAATQHGVVAVWQLHERGIGAQAISRWAAAGWLHRLHRGVYAVGHGPVSRQGRWLGAVLALGEGAVLSHCSAVALWELRPVRSGPVHVTVPAGGRRSRPGIRVHGTSRLDPHDRTVIGGIPVTSLARTLLDYADGSRPQEVRLALDASDRLELLDTKAIDEVLARRPTRRGGRALRAALAEMEGPTPWTRSELERQFLALIRSAGLPTPQANVLVGGYWVDFYWPDAELIVELDGYQFHGGRSKFESDRRMDVALQVSGRRVIRLTQPRVVHEPREVIEDVLRMRAARRPAG